MRIFIVQLVKCFITISLTPVFLNTELQAKAVSGQLNIKKNIKTNTLKSFYKISLHVSNSNMFSYHFICFGFFSLTVCFNPFFVVTCKKADILHRITQTQRLDNCFHHNDTGDSQISHMCVCTGILCWSLCPVSGK